MTGEADMRLGPFAGSKALWLWPTNFAKEPNQYLEFKHEFQAESSNSDVCLCVACDSGYVAKLNGFFVGCGQCHDPAGLKTCDKMQVGKFLKSGRNELLLGIHWQGISSSNYLKGEPGLAYSLLDASQEICSGPLTQWRPAQGYARGMEIARTTPQMGFSFEYDATRCENWRTIDENTMSALLERGNFILRPTQITVVGERAKSTICAQGFFKRMHRTDKEVAHSMQTDFLSAREISTGELTAADGLRVDTSNLEGDGIYLIFDLGREEAGFLELEIETLAGVVVDIANGEHLDDLRVRACVGGRSFANRYICEEGRQVFSHFFHRIAGRYIQLNVALKRGAKFVLRYAGIRPAICPVEEKGCFKTSDPLQAAIYRTGVRTLSLCMHEHYEDCPWREQALYANDARNQALAGYYAFGDYAFPAASHRLLSKGLKDDGLLELCFPAEIPITIPAFTLTWILALKDHWLYSGDTDFAKEMLPVVEKILTPQTARLSNGLLPCPQGERYWQFYDWAKGLDNWDGRIQAGQLRFDAPLNFLFKMALEAAAAMALQCDQPEMAYGWKTLATETTKVLHESFWDSGKGLYRTYIGDGATFHYAELSQALALLSNVCPKAISSGLREKLVIGEDMMVNATLSQSLYKFEAILDDAERYGERAFKTISDTWGDMLFHGATSFWETSKGAADFGNAGSLCHGWSAIPVYFYHANLLGIRPLQPGFSLFRLSPNVKACSFAKGTIPTPRGPLTVEWAAGKSHVDIEITIPVGLRCVMEDGQILPAGRHKTCRQLTHCNE